jgi:hypothetical protein
MKITAEAGKLPEPRLVTLRKLARALGVTLDKFAGEHGGTTRMSPT